MPAKTLRLHAAQLALCLAAALGLFFAGGLWAQEERYRGEVVSVADGDTITVLTTDFERIKVRFYGIDCPEKGQPFGQEAKAYLNSLVYGKTVDVEVLDTDRYSRFVGLVSLNGVEVNKLMVSEGWAWTYTFYCKVEGLCRELQASEKRARGQKKGLWSDPESIPPWEWRKNRRS